MLISAFITWFDMLQHEKNHWKETMVWGRKVLEMELKVMRVEVKRTTGKKSCVLEGVG